MEDRIKNNIFPKHYKKEVMNIIQVLILYKGLKI